ncbi:urease subunit beta [Pedococcus soli]
MSSNSSGPGAVRVKPGTVTINADRTEAERLSLVIVNTGDRPVQIGSHLHLPDSNTALSFDRDAAHGFRLDIPSGTSVRFEPGVSRQVDAVALTGRRRVPGLQVDGRTDGRLDGPADRRLDGRLDETHERAEGGAHDG